MGTDTAALWSGLQKAGAERFETLDEFRAQYTGPYISWLDAGWAPRVFATFKEHPHTYLDRPLALPKARKWSDLFASALYARETPTPGGGTHYAAPKEARFLWLRDGAADIRSEHFGGTRTIRKFPDKSVVRGVFGGAKFHHVYVVPHKTTDDAANGCGYAYEAVNRGDGVLIIANSGAIFREWIALLDPQGGESLAAMLSEEDRRRIADTRALEHAAWGHLVTVDGREYEPQDVPQ